jgi:hypothetical protein
MFTLNTEDKIIVFKTYVNVIEAELDKSKLDDSGIECFLTGLNNASFGMYQKEVRLYIFEKDCQKVYDLFVHSNKHILDSNEVKVKCPNCKSTNVKYCTTGLLKHRDLTSLFVLIQFLILLFPFFSKRIYRCNNCGYEFKIKKNRSASSFRNIVS